MDQAIQNQDPTQMIAQMQAIFQKMVSGDQAAIYASSTGQDQEVRVMTLKLDTAQLSTNPLKIGFPFKTLYAFSATDVNTTVNVRIGRDSYNDPLTFGKGNFFSMPFPVREAYIDWSAQAGKSITLIFLLRGTFATNVQQLSIAGQVQIGDGSAVTTNPVATVSTAAQLFASDTSRIKMQICNYGGTSIYLGDAAVTDENGANPGIELQPGGQYAWENSAACWAVSLGGVSNAKIAYIKFS